MTRFLVRIALAAALVAGATGLAAAETHELKIGTVAPQGTPWANLLVKFRKNVEKASGGRLKVKVYLGGTMGDENAMVRMTARGRLQGVGVSTGSFASLIPELNAIELPFLFRDAKEADYVLDKVLLDPMEDLFRKRGLVFGFWSENGFRHFGSSWGPIDDPGDVKGKKMRSQESFVHLKMWEALDANAQAIPTTEVITALKTGAVDGFDQALLFAIAAGWYKSIEHLTLSAHIYQPAAIAYNKDWFDKLPADLQKILIDEGRKLVRPGRRAIRALNPELVKIIRGEGIAIHTLSDAQRAAFEKQTAAVRKQFRASQGKEAARLLDLIEQGLKQIRGR